MQQKALVNCAGAFYSSEWAGASAVGDYETPRHKIHVVPFGANLNDPPASREVEKLIEQRLDDQTVHFLFVGVDWKRKGGQLAVEMVRQIVSHGINAKLDIVGCMPPEEVKTLSFVTCHGFLSKRVGEEGAHLRTLYARARFFIMLPEAECYGCVFCEANAFGLPIITRATGGIGEIVKNDLNGLVVVNNQEEVVGKIVNLCRNPASYREMALRALNEYGTRLNWDCFAEAVEKVICRNVSGCRDIGPVIVNASQTPSKRARMKLLITGIDEPRDVESWSGIPYFLSKHLSERFELCFTSGLKPPTAWFQDWLRRWYWYSGQGWYLEEYESKSLDAYARHIESAVEREKPDAILAIRCEPLAHLETKCPVYFVHDATFRLLINYYPAFSGLCRRTLRALEIMQQKALVNCAGAFYSSEWAGASASGDYETPRHKIHVVPFGANLSDPPSSGEVEKLIDQRLDDQKVHFLFVGMDWKRKGIQLAVEMVRQIVSQGIDAKLDIVGCMPPEEVKMLSFVTCHGFLSKRIGEEGARLRALYARARFFIMLPEAECTPCVFNEANAFWLPIITRATGGIGEIVKNDVNGLVVVDNQEEVVGKIVNLCRNPASYREMALRALNEYETRLNWDCFAEAVEKVICRDVSGH
ncbi:MAG: glycosyltransferase family 4 protein [Methylacidiphilales bacterium]|nr:glycosyltransferase family 4 protein [Candidatus Methylacidiphilales bacterium]